MATATTTIGDLDDRALLDAAKRFAIEEQRATAALLRVLAEVDARRLYLGEGCASLFAWCTQVLHLSEGGAYNRIEAARAARSYPLIFELVEQAAITLAAVRLLAPHLTLENHQSILNAARHKSKREVEVFVAALQPRPDAPTVVRRLPALPTRPPAALVRDPNAPSTEPITAAPPTSAVRPMTAPPARSSANVTPLTAERYRIQVTVSRDTHDKFRRAQALLRHAVPTGDGAEVLDRALTLLVEHLERRRFAETSRPRAAAPSPERSRHIPAAVRREVWKRDHGRCAFSGREGRCTETAFLEFHHVEPYAAGGSSTVQNVELRCRAHNRYEAQLFFGNDVVREARDPSSSRALCECPRVNAGGRAQSLERVVASGAGKRPYDTDGGMPRDCGDGP